MFIINNNNYNCRWGQAETGQGGPEEGGPCQGEKKDRWAEEEGVKRKIPERGSGKEDEGDGGRELCPQEKVGWVERQVIYEGYVEISNIWDSYIFRDNQMQMQVDQDNPPGQQDVLILSQEQLNTSMLVFILFSSSPSPAGWRICGCPPSSPGKRQELPCPPCYHEIWDVRSFPSTSNMKMK